MYTFKIGKNLVDILMVTCYSVKLLITCTKGDVKTRARLESMYREHCV